VHLLGTRRRQPHSLDFWQIYCGGNQGVLECISFGPLFSFHLWWDFELVAFCEQRRNLSSQISAIARSYNRLGSRDWTKMMHTCRG
jgi:hypothetical protein